MGQDIFDLTFVLIIFFFTIRGYFNGLVGEVAAIISLVGGFWAAYTFHPLLAPKLTFITEPAWRVIAAYIVLFVAVVIAVALAARLLQKILSLAFASWIDSLGGALFGLAKGILLCSLVFILMGKFFYNFDFYKNSRVRPYMTVFTDKFRAALPADIKKKFSL